MSTSLQTQAVLLMTVWLTKPAKDDPKPLTPSEWGRFAAWLKSQQKSPETLLTSADPMDVLQGWLDRSVTPDRIRHLLGRSGALGLTLERWQRAGLWVMTRSDPDYPSRLKQRLKLEAPPVLFGCGNRQLLDQGGIAVVGSRAARTEDLAYTSQLGANIAEQGFSVISGGAAGVDETAMLGALARDGTTVGVLADNLLRNAISSKYRNGLLSKNLALVSSFNPEAPFNVGNAMARNKYIYCLADAGIVVTASRENGGTWAGAIENLKQGWVPLWIKEHADPGSGNSALVQRGARWLPSPDFAVESLVSRQHPDPQTASTASSLHAEGEREAIESSAESEDLSFYEIFIHRLEALALRGPVSLEDLLRQIDVGKSQIQDWIKRAEAEGRIRKLTKPVRYTSRRAEQRRLDL